MARSHLTLAALATSAVPGLDLVAASTFGTGAHRDYHSALLTDRGGQHLLARSPRNERAVAEQAAELAALNALSAGVRTRLSFSAPTFAGQTADKGVRAMVFEYLYGAATPLGHLDADHAASMARAIAAIHALPTSFISDAGLPLLTPNDCLQASIALLDRAAATGLVPRALLSRWEDATEEPKLWQFQATVINGSLTAASFLFEKDAVAAVVGWHALSVGDPARDLFWLLGARGELVAERGFDSYNEARGSADRQVRQRAMLYAELEIAKWLLHGTETRNTDIVDDAVGMLHRLLDNVQDNAVNPISAQTTPVMGVGEVEEMLSRSERTS